MTKLEEFDFEHFRKIPEKPGFITHDRYCTYKELEEAVVAYLALHTVKDLRADLHFEYIDASAPWDKKDVQIPKFMRIYSYACPGSNEGYYIHIESSYYIKSTTLVLMKIFTDINTLIELNSIVTRFIIETLEK